MRQVQLSVLKILFEKSVRCCFVVLVFFNLSAGLWDVAVKFRFSPTNHMHLGIALKSRWLRNRQWRMICILFSYSDRMKPWQCCMKLAPWWWGEKCRRNKDFPKFLEMEIPLFKVLIFTLHSRCLLLEDTVLRGRCYSSLKARCHNAGARRTLFRSTLSSPCVTAMGGYWSVCGRQPWLQPLQQDTSMQVSLITTFYWASLGCLA